MNNIGNYIQVSILFLWICNDIYKNSLFYKTQEKKRAIIITQNKVFNEIRKLNNQINICNNNKYINTENKKQLLDFFNDLKNNKYNEFLDLQYKLYFINLYNNKE
jgi:hypothetical protein